MAIPFDRALATVLEAASPLDAFSISVAAACGRVLAAELVAPADVPAYRRSAVDGFAVRAAELSRPGTELVIVGSILAGGDASELAQVMAARAGCCCRVATGAPVPAGADTVVMLEHVTVRDSTALFQHAAQVGKHVIGVGEDVQRGERLLLRGRRLRPQDVGVMASLGLTEVQVQRAPKLEIVVTGNEIVPLGRERGGTQIVDSNSLVLAQLALRDGAEVSEPVYTGDDPERIEQRLRNSEADVLLVSGGSSVGEEDHAPRVLAQAGSVAFRGVQMRPGSPTAFGTIGSKAVFLVPGHPLACLAAYETLIGPFVRALGGRDSAWPHPSLEAVLAQPIDSARGRLDYVRVERVGEGRVRAMTRHLGASNLSSALRADGVVLVPAHVASLEAGAVVRVFLY